VFTLTVTDGNTCTGSATTSVTVNTVNATISVSAPFPGVTTICAGTPVTFNAIGNNGSGNYNYEFHRIRGVNDDIVQPAGPSVTYVASGADAPQNGDRFYVVVSDTDTGCDATSTSITINVVTNPVPTLTITNNGGSSVICENELLDIEATPVGFARYVFTINGTSVQDGNSNVFSYNGYNDGDKVNVTAYTDLSATACFGTSTDLSIQVNSRPTPVISGDLVVCPNSTKSYSADTPGLGKGNYTWVVAGGTATGALDEETVEVIWDGTAPHSISLNYVNANNCAALVPTVESVTVNSVVAGLSADKTTICTGEDVTFTASGGTTYKFYIDDVEQVVADPTAAEFVASGLTNGQVVKVTAFDAIGCEDTHAGITITEVSNPNPTLTITNNGGSAVICDGETLDFEVIPVGFARYVFTIEGTIVQDGVDNTLSYTGFNDGEKINVTAYTDLTATACFGTSTDLTITVNARPTPAISGDMVVCPGSSKTYIADTPGLGKGSYTWVIQGGTPTGDLDEETVEVIWDGSAPHSISLNYVNVNNCAALIPTVQSVTVNSVVAGLSADKTTICSGEDVSFTATGGITYVFLIDDVPQVVADPTDNVFVASGLTNGQVVKVKAIDAIGCEDTHAGITITVIDTPNPVITTGPDVVCNGEEATYTAEGGYVNYVWNVTGGSITTDPTLNSVNVKWDTDGVQSIEVTYSSAGGTCVGATYTLPVTVNALPSGTTFVAAPSNNVIKGTDITFTATGGDEYAFFVNGTEAQARGASNTFVVSTEAPSANTVVAHGDVVRVVIYNAAGCSVFQEITVGIYEGIALFDVIASEQGHCFGQSIASISLSGYQEGITYELFRIGTPDISLGKVLANASIGTVQWLNVQGASPADEFKVVAYYDGTPPTPPIDMNNTVFVEEYADLGIYNLSPTSAQNCGDVIDITLDNSDAGVDYQLLNGSTVLQTQTSAGGLLTFTGVTLSVGTYSINAVKVNPGATCEAVMNGSLTVSGDPTITLFDIEGTKGGKYCDDGVDAVTITLSGSQSAYNYELYYNNAPIAPTAVIVPGNDGVISFGSYTTEGDYSVIMVASGCTYYMNEVVTVEKVPLPAAFNLIAEDNGHYCPDDVDGVEIYLDAFEAGIDYQLYLDGNPVGAPINGIASFGNHLAEGEYTVIASTSSPSLCTVASTNSVNVVKDNVPVTITLQGDTEFCQGDVGNLFIVNPEGDVDYELVYNGTPTGDLGSVNGSRIEWTVNVGGIYRVQAIKNNANTTCGPVLMPGEVALIEVPLPADKTVSVIVGDPALCEGTTIKVVSPEPSMQYAVVSNITNQILAGYVKNGTDVNTDGDIEFDPISDNSGSYRVEAYNGACSIVLDNTGSGEVNEILINNPNAVARKELVIPNAICEGDGAVNIIIRSTDLNTNYDLYRVVTGGTDILVETLVGDGNDLSFSGLLNEGEYYVMGYRPPLLPTDPCSNEMLNRVTIVFNPLPVSYRLVGSGISCGTDNPAVIGIEGSEADVEYTLVYDNPTSGKEIIEIKEGSGSQLSFSGVTAEGTYTVYAKSITTGCTSSMEGAINVATVTQVTNQMLSKSNYIYCSNDVGAEVILMDQEFGVLYEVRDVATGTVVVSKVGDAPGTSLILGVVSTGTYEVWGSYNGACTALMNGGNTVSVTSEPTVPLLDPSVDVEYCYGEDGIDVSVTNTTVGIGYQLIDQDGTGNIVTFVSGNGGRATFPNKIKGTETYKVVAISFNTGCTSESSSITITEKEELFAYNVILRYGNGETNLNCVDNYCYGLIQVDTIKLDMSTVGVDYTLMHETGPLTIVSGTGAEISFGVQSEGGDYYVIASRDGCITNMNGSVKLAIEPLEAINDVVGLQKGEAIGEYNVAENDRYLANLDYYPEEENDVDKYRNLTYEIISSWDYLNAEGVPQLFETIGEASINSEGKLEYKKQPNFFGRDSVRYRVTNTLQPDRTDIATVFIFVGNVSVGDNEELLIPNAFSPNGDGWNDTYVISGTFVDENTVSKLEVFNRWGTVVYRSKGDSYGKDGDYWDGRANAGAMVSLGDKLPSGTYFYVFTIDVNIDGKVETKQYSGFIELRR
jgi:gliding motility-associated-like protein